MTAFCLALALLSACGEEREVPAAPSGAFYVVVRSWPEVARPSLGVVQVCRTQWADASGFAGRCETAEVGP